MNTKNYYESIEFSYLKTFSFHRGQKLEEYLLKKDEEIALTEESISKARYMQIPKLEQQLKVAKQDKDLYSIGLFNKQGNINESASEISLIKHGSAQTEELKKIFNTPVRQHIVSGCIPIYRDAIVFYDQNGKIQQVLDICFQCLYLKTSENTFLEADIDFYNKLIALLKSLGHDISSN